MQTASEQSEDSGSGFWLDVPDDLVISGTTVETLSDLDLTRTSILHRVRKLHLRTRENG